MRGHRYWLKNLSAYFDNELTEYGRQKIELHLAECKICQSQLIDWQKIEEIRKGIPVTQPTQEVWQSISYQLKSEPIRPLAVWEEDWITQFLPSPITAIATAVLVILIVLGVQPYLTSQESSPINFEQYLFSESDSMNGNSSDLSIILPDES